MYLFIEIIIVKSCHNFLTISEAFFMFHRYPNIYNREYAFFSTSSLSLCFRFCRSRFLPPFLPRYFHPPCFWHRPFPSFTHYVHPSTRRSSFSLLASASSFSLFFSRSIVHSGLFFPISVSCFLLLLPTLSIHLDFHHSSSFRRSLPCAISHYSCCAPFACHCSTAVNFSGVLIPLFLLYFN